MDTVRGRLEVHLADSVQGELSGEQPGYSLVPGKVSRQEYRDLIERLYGWYSHLDARLAQLKALHVVLRSACCDIMDFRRTEALEMDLAALGCSGMGLAEIPRCTSIGRVRSVVDGLALLYVSSVWESRTVEVAERMYVVWGVAAGSGAAFFDRSAKLVRMNQEGLGRVLEEYCGKQARERRLQQSAAAALARLTDWVRNPIEGERFLADDGTGADRPHEE